MSLLDDAIGIAKQNPVGVAVGSGVVGIGAGLAVGSLLGSSSKKKSGRKIKHTSRGWKQDRKRRSKQKWEVAYQKRKKKGRTGKIHYTKKGQPYIILKSGKARFVKKSKRRTN